MATQIYNEKGITITRFSRGFNKGAGYQVTWDMDNYVHFETELDAVALVNLLNKRIKIERL